jgi:hypothetical protein
MARPIMPGFQGQIAAGLAAGIGRPADFMITAGFRNLENQQQALQRALEEQRRAQEGDRADLRRQLDEFRTATAQTRVRNMATGTDDLAQRNAERIVEARLPLVIADPRRTVVAPVVSEPVVEDTVVAGEDIQTETETVLPLPSPFMMRPDGTLQFPVPRTGELQRAAERNRIVREARGILAGLDLAERREPVSPRVPSEPASPRPVEPAPRRLIIRPKPQPSPEIIRRAEELMAQNRNEGAAAAAAASYNVPLEDLGRSNAEIAQALGITTQQVNSFRSRTGRNPSQQEADNIKAGKRNRF